MPDIDPADFGRALSQVPLFREIQRVLSAQSGPVNWEIARQIAESIADAEGPGVPPDTEDIAGFVEACRVAEMRVAEISGFEPMTALDAVEVLDRKAWTKANLEGFRFLIDRLASRLGSQLAPRDLPELPFTAALGAIGPFLFGVQIGFLMGYLSHQVLGQYDLCLPRTEAGKLYFVYPNIVRIERDLDLDPQQFRMWLALHEVTHTLEFSSVDWTRAHFIGLLERYIDAAELDSDEVAERLQGLGDPERLSRLMERPDELIPLMLTSEQQVILKEIQAFMSVLEGYAEWTMDVVGKDLLPDFERMREAINRMRAERSSAERLFEALLGIDLKREQYRAGEKFVRVAADAGKTSLLWEGPHRLPTMDEVEDPPAWLSRVGFS